MDRLEKKCVVASTGMHLFLVCVLLLGSAFFVPSQKPVDTSKMPKLKVIPGKLVDDLLSGGGGNPNLKITEERIKGETMRPVAEEVKEVPPPPKPEPKTEPKRAEKVEKVEKIEKAPPKPDKLNLVPTVRNKGKEPTKVSPINPKDSDIKLTPAKLTAAEKARRQAEADAKEFALAETNRRRDLGKALDKMKSGLRAGFTDGTVVDVGGPGGIAYANYAQFVKEVYDNNWNIPTDFLDENATAKVIVVIDRSGNVLNSRIEKYSGNSTLDRSVQRALDRVKFVHEFPEDSKDQKRTFTINFNLKAKQLG